MQQIKNILKASVKKYKIEDKIKSHELLGNWEKIISRLLPEAAGKTMVLSFERGVLHVAALSRETANVINQLQKRIIYAINNIAGKTLVFRIYCEA